MRADDIDQAPGTAAETIVKSQQPAAEDASERDVFCVVCPGPPELVGDAPRFSVELMRRAATDRSGQQRGERSRSKIVRDLTSPPQLVDRRQRFRPQHRWGDEGFVLEKADPRRRETGLNERARIDDEQCSAALSRAPDGSHHVGHRLACRRLAPCGRQGPPGSGHEHQEIGFVDDVLRPDTSRAQAPGPDPTANGLRVTARAAGGLGDGQHARSILQHSALGARRTPLPTRCSSGC